MKSLSRYYKLEKKFGKRKTKLIAQNHVKAIDFIEKVVQNEGIECDFERVYGFLFADPSDEKNVLTKELEAATNAGLDLTLLENIPGMKNEKGP